MTEKGKCPSCGTDMEYLKRQRKWTCDNQDCDVIYVFYTGRKGFPNEILQIIYQTTAIEEFRVVEQ